MARYDNRNLNRILKEFVIGISSTEEYCMFEKYRGALSKVVAVHVINRLHFCGIADNIWYIGVKEYESLIRCHAFKYMNKVRSLRLRYVITQQSVLHKLRLEDDLFKLSYSKQKMMIERLPDEIGCLKELVTLDISSTTIKIIPDSVANLTKLEYLFLDNTLIEVIPSWINKLSRLQIITLSNLKIQSLPKTIMDLGLPFKNHHYLNDSWEKGIFIGNTTLMLQPISLFYQEREFIEAYFKSEMIAVNSTKIIIIGQGGAGKTFTLKRMINGGERKDYHTDETKGVDIYKHTFTRNGRQFDVSFWDFGGQAVMHSMHRCFLTERTCYLLVVDSRRSDMNMMAQARYWLKNIASFAPKSPVIILTNLWDDDVYRGDLDERRLHDEFDDYLDIKRVIPLSAKKSPKEEFRINLIDKVVDMAASMISLEMQFPKDWNDVRNEIRNIGNDVEKSGKNKYYISQQDYYAICERHGIIDPEKQLWLLDWFNDLGECISYFKKGDNRNIAEYKVLDPQWITNAIYILITRGYFYVDQKRCPGVLSRTHIEKLLDPAMGGTVKDIKRYSPEECQYIIMVMQKFELAYHVSDGDEYLFIPALLPISVPDDVRPKEYREKIRFEIRYKFLPLNLLQILMVRNYSELEINKCWEKGMMLYNKAIKQTALLDMGGGDDILYIEVYAHGDYPPSGMLNLLIQRLKDVNDVLSLNPEYYVVIENEEQDKKEEPVKLNKLLRLKAEGISQYQGELRNYSVDALLGNTFGIAVKYVEKELKKKDLAWHNSERFFSFIQSLLSDEKMSMIITRRDFMSREINIKDGNYIEHADSSNQTIHGNIYNRNSQIISEKTQAIEKLAKLLGENLPILTSTVEELQKTNQEIASDLRDINVQLTIARARKEEKVSLERLIQFLSTADDITTIGTAILGVSHNPAVVDTVCKLLQLN